MKQIRLSLLFALCLVCSGTGYAQNAQAANSATSSSSAAAAAAGGTRIGDITELRGIRTNQLVGVGILTGLDGKGDGSRSVPIRSSLAVMLGHFGIEVDAQDAAGKNSALVLVTADVPPFASPGDRIDITISALFDAKNVKGGVLLQTPLKSAGGDVYAVAQGKVERSGESSTVGEIIGGAVMENRVHSDVEGEGGFTLLLERPNYRVAYLIREAIANAYPDLSVSAGDASSVSVTLGEDGDLVRLIGEIQQLRIDLPRPSKVVIDEASGIVVMGGNVQIAPVTVTYRGATIEVGPPGWNSGNSNGFSIEETVSVQKFFEVLQSSGIGTDDIIDILKVIDRAGALYGSLEMM
jgi:flagellar P-ring protein precursor FlgI